MPGVRAGSRGLEPGDGTSPLSRLEGTDELFRFPVSPDLRLEAVDTGVSTAAPAAFTAASATENSTGVAAKRAACSAAEHTARAATCVAARCATGRAATTSNTARAAATGARARHINKSAAGRAARATGCARRLSCVAEEAEQRCVAPR